MRRRRATKRKITPDHQFDSTIIAKLINNLMIGGKRSQAERIVYSAIKDGAKKISVEEKKFIDQVIVNSQPSKHTVPKRFGGTTYHIPREISPENRAPIAVKIIVKSMRSEVRSKGIPATKALTEILAQSYNNTGPVIATKNELHNAWVRNEPFAHF